MQITKKLLSVFLAITLMLGSAAVANAENASGPVCRIGETDYATIGEAINAVTVNDTVITVIRDCEFDGLTEVAGYDIILESGDTDVTITLTGAMKFGKNNQSKFYTLRGNPTAETTLTIRPKLTDGTNAFRPIAVRRGNTLTVESGAILEGSRFTAGNGGMVNVAKGATLNLNGGTIRNCSAIQGGAVYVDGGGCTLYEGKIENCTAEQGGAVYVTYNGKCMIYDGSIENCTARHRTQATAANSSVSAAGGAVYAVGLLQMENSTIIDCTAECGKGGGVYLYPEQGTFWMQDSEISGCAATENEDADLYYNDGRGGGIYVGMTQNTDAPSLCVVGSRITGNTAKEGGGVYLHEDGTMAAYREAYVSENTAGNVFVSDGAAIITVMENSQYALTGNAMIGVTTRTEPTIGSPVRFGKAKADCSAYFVSDSADADVLFDAGSKALLLQCTKKEQTPAATFNATGYDTGTLDGLTAGMTYAVNGGTPVTVEDTSVTFTDIALPFVITVVQPGDGVTAYDSDPQTIELTRADTPALEVTPPEKAGDKGVIPTTTAHQKSTDGVNWTDCDGEWTDLGGGTYYVRTKANGTTLASDAQQFSFRYDPQMTVSAENVFAGEDAAVTVTLPGDATGSVDFTLTSGQNTYTFDGIPIIDGKAAIGEKLNTDSYAVTVSYSGNDKYLAATVQTTFSVFCPHIWNEPTWDWTDVDNPAYATTCTLCADGEATGTVQSTPGTHVEATVDEDAYTPYTASVTIDGQTFTDTFNLVEKGTAFNVYKEQMKQAAEDKRLPEDSDECNQLIDDAIAAIDEMTYDENKSLDENKQAVDTAADFDQLDADLAEHRAIHYADFYADGTLVESVPYTIDTQSIKDKEPDIPDKPGHTGKWSSYTLKAGGVRIDAVYEVNMQTVTFDPNGGKGEMDSVTAAWGSTITLPECTFTAPNGKEFDKWDAGKPGDEVEIKSDLTVTAIWKEAPLTLTADVDPAQTGERIAIRVPYVKRGAIAATLTASEEGVRFESSKPDVISVDENGSIRLEKLCLFCRSATITAYSASGEKVATCVVNVRHAWWQYLIWLLLGSFWF